MAGVCGQHRRGLCGVLLGAQHSVLHHLVEHRRVEAQHGDRRRDALLLAAGRARDDRRGGRSACGLGIFVSLKNQFSPADSNNYPVGLAWISRQPSAWGLFSLFTGVLALLIICPVSYLNSLPPLNFNFSSLFNFLYKQRSFAEEAFAASVFDINPGHFLAWCTYSAIILAVAAMASALQAKIRGEDSLYRAAGCVCGALTLTVFDPRLAVYAGLTYGVASYLLELKTAKQGFTQAPTIQPSSTSNSGKP